MRSSSRSSIGRRSASAAFSALAAVAALWGGLALTPARAATPGVDAPPEAGPALPVQVPAIDSFELPNGLRVVVATRRQVPLVTAQLLVRAG